ncbi:SRPBCC family protein [Streptomyces gilvosporeus]|uniref:Cyclase n=1 Tax=Streptomyces gilvosporeus TaxID=553510 RepID=A0A1V0TLX6_9ACTN|nr:SRPBCC family protein [Streptomyces gilvosporeus]ARF53945.1 cyclase [Streptomyces gilvosporeus]
MSTLEEHVDIGAPVDKTWDCLHRVDSIPQYVDGVREAHLEGKRTHLDLEAGGPTRELDLEITDRTTEKVMSWQTTGGPDLAGSVSLLPIDRGHTRVQARFEYDPGTIKDDFGGPKGFAQAAAIERGLRSDLQQFKSLVEHEK